jgi:hypothetical protein
MVVVGWLVAFKALRFHGFDYPSAMTPLNPAFSAG